MFPEKRVKVLGGRGIVGSMKRTEETITRDMCKAPVEMREELAESVIREICLLKDEFERQCEEACLSGVWKERVRELIGGRVGRIKQGS